MAKKKPTKKTVLLAIKKLKPSAPAIAPIVFAA